MISRIPWTTNIPMQLKAQALKFYNGHTYASISLAIRLEDNVHVTGHALIHLCTLQLVRSHAPHGTLR